MRDVSDQAVDLPLIFILTKLRVLKRVLVVQW